jgi:hypothetical protein
MNRCGLATATARAPVAYSTAARTAPVAGRDRARRSARNWERTQPAPAMPTRARWPRHHHRPTPHPAPITPMALGRPGHRRIHPPGSDHLNTTTSPDDQGHRRSGDASAGNPTCPGHRSRDHPPAAAGAPTHEGELGTLPCRRRLSVVRCGWWRELVEVGVGQPRLVGRDQVTHHGYRHGRVSPKAWAAADSRGLFFV